MTHKAKDCVERPRTKGAKLTGRDIAPDEKIEKIEMDYESAPPPPAHPPKPLRA